LSRFNFDAIMNIDFSEILIIGAIY